jgi:uncharacterized membrane protein YhhN
VAHLTFEGSGVGIPWLKPWPVVCLAIWVFQEGSGLLGRLTAIGLAVSAGGDLAIERSFVLGLVMFLTAHLAYVGAFVADERRLRLLYAIPFIAYAWAALHFLLPRVAGDLAHPGGLSDVAPIGVYALAIATMMWRAAARVRPGERAGWIALAGAVCFALSDTLLAVDRFRFPVPGATYPIMLSYWAGQLGIAASAVRSR